MNYTIFIYKDQNNTVAWLIRNYFHIWNTSKYYSLLTCLRDAGESKEVYVIYSDDSYTRLV